MLSDDLQKLAKKELGETEEVRNVAIKTMRDWIVDNPRIIKCRMDSKFILRFLRFRKFNIEEAKEAFERYLVFREGLYGYDWFSNLDYGKPDIPELLDNGLIIVFPKPDKHGRKIILSRFSTVNPSLPMIGCQAFTLATLFVETLLDDEENQIRGLNYIFDVSNIKFRHYFIFPFSAWFKMGKNVEVSEMKFMLIL